MMTVEVAIQRWLQPHAARLLMAAAGVQILLISVPMLWGVKLVWMVSGLLMATAVVVFSLQRTLLLMLGLTIALPASVLSGLVLPGGVRFQEGLFLAAGAFALIDWVSTRAPKLRRGPLDVPLAVFLLVAVASAGVGAAAGNLTTVIFRDLRFPLYYAVIYLVTQDTGPRDVVRYFVPLIIGAAVVVSIEYVLEFLGAIELSSGSRFVRVARLQGLVLPVALLLLVNQLVHDAQRYGRWLLIVCFLPISLAFVLTVGRGMWLGFAVGVAATVVLWQRSRPQVLRRTWHVVVLIVGLSGAIVLTAIVFQRVTGSAIGAHALERSLTFVDFSRDVQFLGRVSSYVLTVEQVIAHPLLGSGQGATLPFFIFAEDAGSFRIHRSWTVDNLYLALLWKMGGLGLAAFAWLMLRSVRLAWRSFAQTCSSQIRAFTGGVLAVAAAMAVLGLSDSSMVSSRFALVFGMLLGMVAVVAREGGKTATERGAEP